MKKTLYLVRHGETQFNVEKKFQGAEQDTKINKNGIRQAEITAEFFKDIDLGCIYSSPLKRTVMTAKTLRDRVRKFYKNKKKLNKSKTALNKIPLKIHKGLEELAIGEYAGLSHEDFKKKIGGEERYRQFMESKDEGLDITLYEESKGQARTRIKEAVADIAEKAPYDNICVVSHSFMLREFLRAMNYDQDLSKVANCEIIKVEYDTETKEMKVVERIKVPNPRETQDVKKVEASNTKKKLPFWRTRATIFGRTL